MDGGTEDAPSSPEELPFSDSSSALHFSSEAEDLDPAPQDSPDELPLTQEASGCDQDGSNGLPLPEDSALRTDAPEPGAALALQQSPPVGERSLVAKRGRRDSAIAEALASGRAYLRQRLATLPAESPPAAAVVGLGPSLQDLLPQCSVSSAPVVEEGSRGFCAGGDLAAAWAAS